MPELDPEEFLTWLEQPLTQMVLGHFRQRAQEGLSRVQEQLLHNLTSEPSQWANQQSQAAYLKGLFSGFLEVADVSFEDIKPEETE